MYDIAKSTRVSVIMQHDDKHAQKKIWLTIVQSRLNILPPENTSEDDHGSKKEVFVTCVSSLSTTNAKRIRIKTNVADFLSKCGIASDSMVPLFEGDMAPMVVVKGRWQGSPQAATGVYIASYIKVAQAISICQIDTAYIFMTFTRLELSSPTTTTKTQTCFAHFSLPAGHCLHVAEWHPFLCISTG
jgi:hypothetical protein